MNINKMIQDAKKSLTDRQVFQSQEMQEYLERKASAVHKDWHIPDIPCYIDYDSHSNTAARTNNAQYYINAGHKLVSGTREKKLDLVRGLLMHEIGHRLFTSFTALGTYLSYFDNGRLYPGKPKVSMFQQKQLTDLAEYIADDENAKKAGPVIKTMTNILEDGRIEYMLQSYADRHLKLINGLGAIRQQVYEKMDSFQELKKRADDGEISRYVLFMQILLHYVRFGEIKGFDISMADDEVIKMFDKAQPFADACVEALTSVEFYKAFNQLLVIMWPDIKDYLDQIENNIQKPRSSATSKGNGEPAQSPSPSDIAETVADQLSKIQGLTPDQDEDLTGEGSDEKDVKALLKQLQAEDSETPEGPSAAPPYTRTTSIRSIGSGKMSKIHNYKEESNTSIDLEKILNTISKNAVDKELENKLIKDLMAFNANINYGKIHNCVDCKIYRHEVSSYDRVDYESIAPVLKNLAKKLAKKTDYFAEDTSPIPVKGQYYGKKFNAPSAARSDYRYFSRDIILEEPPTVAVAVCIDESGSMDGQRSQAAKAMAITLYEYCDIMQIPIAIYGHTASSCHVSLFAYADFDKHDPNDRYRLMSISSRNANRDGYAIRFLKRRLSVQEAESKLLIVVTDGRPADYGYEGTAANADLQDIAKSCEKDGIALVVAAIGEDKPYIKSIYGEKHFLDISNLSSMPIIMANQIKRLLK